MYGGKVADYNMTSLISFYDFEGRFIDQILGIVNLTQDSTSMDSGTLVLQNTLAKLSEDFIRPGNFVYVEDKNLTDPWIGVISIPTSVNKEQTTIALIDPKDILIGLPIISTEGLGLGIVSIQGIAFAIEQTKKRKRRHNFIYTLDENSFTSGSAFLIRDGVVHLGKDIYSFLNELAKEKNFEWWLEPAISGDGILSLKVRTQDIRKSLGNPIFIPKNGSVQGIGLSYSKKYYTSIGIINTNKDTPFFKELIEFPGLSEKFGSRILIIDQNELSGSKQTTSIGQLFKEHRPRRTIQLHIDTQYTELVSSIKLGSVHTTALGGIGFTNNTRGTILSMRVIAMGYNTGENIISIVLEEFFETDELAVLSV